MLPQNRKSCPKLKSLSQNRTNGHKMEKVTDKEWIGNKKLYVLVHKYSYT